MSNIPNFPLEFVKDLQLGVETGERISTVRVGFRNYRPGIVLAVDPAGKTTWGKHLHILEVRWTEARNVEAELMGYESQAAFYEEMKQYGEKYEDFGPDSEVTVIYFVTPDRVEAERREVDELNALPMIPDAEDE